MGASKTGTLADHGAGIILAGGFGARMGRDKASIEYRGESLLSRAVRVVRSVMSEVIVVGPESRQALVDAPVVSDIWPGGGPLGAVVTGLTSVNAESAFVAACDLPLLDPNMVRYLTDLAARNTSEAVVPIVRGRPQVLHAVYRRSAAPRLRLEMERESGRQQSLQRAIGHLTVMFVGEDELRQVDPSLGSFLNVNTESQWREFVTSQP